MTPVAGAVKESVAGGTAGAAAVAGPETGLGARLDAARSALASVVADLDPARLTGADAAGLYASLVGLERLVVAGKTLLAPRIEGSGVWRDGGHRSAAVMLASLEGVATGQAQNTLVNGQRLSQLPGTEAALRTGVLSGPKVTELTGAGILAPEREQELLAGAEEAPLQAVRERCQRSRATSGSEDPRARVVRIRAARYFSSWTDGEGAFCYQGRDTLDRGAQILSHLDQVATGCAGPDGRPGTDRTVPNGRSGPTPSTPSHKTPPRHRGTAFAPAPAHLGHRLGFGAGSRREGDGDTGADADADAGVEDTSSGATAGADADAGAEDTIRPGHRRCHLRPGHRRCHLHRGHHRCHGHQPVADHRTTRPCSSTGLRPVR